MVGIRYRLQGSYPTLIQFPCLANLITRGWLQTLHLGFNESFNYKITLTVPFVPIFKTD